MPLDGAVRLLDCARSWCRSKTQVQAPARSLDQRMEALKRANDIRVKRAQLKKDLKAGRVQIEEILRDRPSTSSTAKVFDMLMAVPKFGRVKAARLPEPVPHQPVEDGGRSLRAPAHGADWPLQPLERASGRWSITGPSGAGKGTLMQALLARVPQLELAVSATTRARREGEQDGVHYYFLGRRVRPAGAGGRVPRARDAPVGPALGTLLSEIERIRARARSRCSSWRPTGALVVKQRVPGRGDDLRQGAASRSSSAGCAAARPRATGEIEERLAAARHQLELADEFDHVIVNDDRERAGESCSRSSNRQLDGAATMAAT